MMDHRISSLRPEPDETLMSFLRRAQLDADCSDDDMQFLAASALLPDARLAERRVFDWQSLSRFFNATPEELYGMSERSFFYREDDASRRGLFRQRAPWVQERGYAAHCPCCLRHSPHWRKSWLGPDALVCSEHNAVMVRHCHGCGGDLSQMTWTNASPICPTCSAHLSLSAVIPASRPMSKHAAVIRDRFTGVVSKKPVEWRDYDLAHFAAMWRAARLLRSETAGLWPLCEAMLSLDDLDQHLTGAEVGALDIRYAQATIAAYLIGEMEPTFSEHFWLSATNATTLLGADRIVHFKLVEFAQTLGVPLPTRSPVFGQLTMSFASWVGAKGMPKAA